MALLMTLMTFLMASFNGDISMSADAELGVIEEEHEMEVSGGRSEDGNSSTVSSGSIRSQSAGEKKRRKHSSLMWDHFTLLTCKKKVQCNLCKRIYPWHKSTTAHTAHLRKKHGNVVNVGPAPIKRFVVVQKKVKPVSKERQRQITDAIMKLMTLDLRPFSVVAGRGFIHLLHVLEPGYKIPHRTTFSRFYLPDHYHVVKAIVASELKSALHLSIGFDLWTDNFKRLNYITLVAHYVDQDWNLKKIVLATRR